MKAVQSNKDNGTAFHDPEIQRELGRRGGPKNKGFVWLNDGTINIKYSPKQQVEKPVDLFLEENPNFVRGRLDTHDAVECPQCGKVGNLGAMMLNHFDNCGKERRFKITPQTCPHCGKVGAGGAMTRFHFDNCKDKKDDH